MAPLQWSGAGRPEVEPIRRLWMTHAQALLVPEVDGVLAGAGLLGFSELPGFAGVLVSFASPPSFFGAGSFVAVGADELDE